MLTKSHTVNGRVIAFSTHAIERYYERTDRSDASALRRDLEKARWDRSVPGFAKLSVWHRARAEGSLVLTPTSAFIVNRNADGDLVAVTFLTSENPGG